jgi:hypothetical protein
LTEAEAAAVGFDIDHFLPRSRYPELEADYGNLFWSCSHCNGFKRDHPTEAAALKGYRFYRADMDDPTDHFAVSDASPTRLEPASELIGKYTIEQLNLNRQTLRRLRELRSRLFVSREVLVRGLKTLEGTRLQALPREARGKFMQVSERLKRDSDRVTGIVDETLLREFTKSDLIAPAASTGHDATLRKRYLKTVNAAVPEK